MLFKVFQFNWGYVESSRIVEGPLFIHTEGFETALEAMQSFKEAIRSMFSSKGCTEHGAYRGEFCATCGKVVENIPGTDEQVYKWFDGLWQIDVDTMAGYMHEMNEHGWHEKWEFNLEDFPKTQWLIFQGTDSFFDPYDEDRWIEANSGDDKYHWNRDS